MNALDRNSAYSPPPTITATFFFSMVLLLLQDDMDAPNNKDVAAVDRYLKQQLAVSLTLLSMSMKDR